MFQHLIEVESDDRLQKTTFRFFVLNNIVCLDYYSTYSRPSRKHGWVSIETWDPHRISKAKKPEVPEGVAAQAVEFFKNQIRYA
jgi:hypothetical protein